MKPESDEKKDRDDKDEEMKDEEVEEAMIDPRDLIDEYDAYLKEKAEKQRVAREDDEDSRMEEDDDVEKDGALRFNQSLERFDYME